jgi:hypothetical protein
MILAIIGLLILSNPFTMQAGDKAQQTWPLLAHYKADELDFTRFIRASDPVPFALSASTFYDECQKKHAVRQPWLFLVARTVCFGSKDTPVFDAATLMDASTDYRKKRRNQHLFHQLSGFIATSQKLSVECLIPFLCLPPEKAEPRIFPLELDVFKALTSKYIPSEIAQIIVSLAHSNALLKDRLMCAQQEIDDLMQQPEQD